MVKLTQQSPRKLVTNKLYLINGGKKYSNGMERITLLPNN